LRVSASVLGLSFVFACVRTRRPFCILFMCFSIVFCLLRSAILLSLR
ncbi:hypothetical protein HMPREF1583_00621, partial [Gardnerella vaginalis JCP8151B]